MLPLLPPIKVPAEATLPSQEVGMAEWRDMVAMAIDQAEMTEEEAMEQGKEIVSF